MVRLASDSVLPCVAVRKFRQLVALLADGQAVHAAKCLEGDGQKDEPLLPAGISGILHFSVVGLIQGSTWASGGGGKVRAGERTCHSHIQGRVFPVTPPSNEHVARPGLGTWQ